MTMRRKPFSFIKAELQRAARKFGDGPNGAQLKRLAETAEMISVELTSELIVLQHRFGRDAVWELITTRVADAIFRDRHFDGDAVAFTRSLLAELRPCLSGAEVAKLVACNEKKGSSPKKKPTGCGILGHRRMLERDGALSVSGIAVLFTRFPTKILLQTIV
jgi:hypothetical protein